MEPESPSSVYLACPECGTRYLARDQRAGDPASQKPRWFHCQRCNKRVKSTEPTEAEAEPVTESASAE